MPDQNPGLKFVVTDTLIVKDIRRSVAFYRDVLGFRLISEDGFAAVFDLNGTMLRISADESFTPQAHTVLGWQVPDIVSAVTALRAKGVGFNTYEGLEQDPLGIWAAPGGARVAWFLDPDGNNLSLAQL